MFISNLNHDQQNKLQTLTQMIINTENVNLTMQKNMQASISPHTTYATTNKNASVSALLELENTFTTQEAKVSLLLELMSATYQHKSSHKDERGLIQAIAWKLNISLQLLKDMECWVELQSVLTKEAKILMGEKTCH